MNEARELYNASSDTGTDVIYYQDCISGMQQMLPETVDLVIADAPYGIGFSGREAFYNRDKEKVIEGYVEVKGDYGEFSRAWISELPRLMRPHATGFIFSGWTHLRHVLNAIEGANLKVINHIIWHLTFPPWAYKKLISSHYHILLVTKNKRKSFFHQIEYKNEDVWKIKKENKPKQEKNGNKLPEVLVRKCIDFGSKPGWTVFDPFMGNGTTATAAKANFRHFLGFEINAKMQRIIDKNLQNVMLGQSYRPYMDRLPTIEELAQRYPRAYQAYLLKESNKKKNPQCLLDPEQ